MNYNKRNNYNEYSGDFHYSNRTREKRIYFLKAILQRVAAVVLAAMAYQASVFTGDAMACVVALPIAFAMMVVPHKVLFGRVED